MKEVYVCVGISASGKSTYVKNRFKPNPRTVYLNADSIRKELYGDENIQGDGQEVFGRLFSRLKTAVRDSEIHTVIIDNTSLSTKDRKKYFELINTCTKDVAFFMLYFPPNLERSKKWNKLRDRQVPEEVLERQASKIQPPSEFEKDWYTIEIIEV